MSIPWRHVRVLKLYFYSFLNFLLHGRGGYGGCEVTKLLSYQKHVWSSTNKLCMIWNPPLMWACGPMQTMASSCLRFLDHTQRRNKVGRTPLDGWSARPSPLPDNTQNSRQIFLLQVGFKPRNPSRRAFADLRPHGHWNLQIWNMKTELKLTLIFFTPAPVATEFFCQYIFSIHFPSEILL